MESKSPSELVITPGQLYEDGFFHPCVCVWVEDEVAYGVSLIDGSYPRGCDTQLGGIRKLSPAEAWEIRIHGPTNPADRELIAPEARWWR